MSKGFDTSVPLSYETASMFAKQEQGYEFVVRYLCPEGFNKLLKFNEAKEISKAGLNIVSVFETTAGRAKLPSNGIYDGRIAQQAAKNAGQPKGTAIYFAVDFEATANDIPYIEQYLRNAEAQMNDYLVGVYGSYFVVEEMYKCDACKYFWQTYAWSYGKLSRHANLYQFHNGEHANGIEIDEDKSFGNEGWWNLNMDKSQISAWAVDAHEWIMGQKISDGTRPKDNVTREELWTMLYNFHNVNRK